MRYTNFDIWIDHHDGQGYPVRALTDSLLGEARERMILAPEEDPLRTKLCRCANCDTDQEFLKAFGSFLFEHLFQGDVGLLFQQLAGQNFTQPEQGIRLRLRIEPPEIAALPWELLYTPPLDFLCSRVKCTIVRYIELMQPVACLNTLLPIHLLVVIPHPVNTPESRFPVAPLDSDREKANLLRALEGLQDVIKPTFLEGPVSWQRIWDTLNENEFHCFHFIGHGFFENDRVITVKSWCVKRTHEQEARNE